MAAWRREDSHDSLRFIPGSAHLTPAPRRITSMGYSLLYIYIARLSQRGKNGLGYNGIDYHLGSLNY